MLIFAGLFTFDRIIPQRSELGKGKTDAQAPTFRKARHGAGAFPSRAASQLQCLFDKLKYFARNEEKPSCQDPSSLIS
jgi:hypothetical protein